MAKADERKTYGTQLLDAAVARDDFERALRYLHLSDIDQRDLLLRLAAQVVALTEALDRRSSTTEGEALALSVAAALPDVLDRIRVEDARRIGRVWLDTTLDNKYEIESTSPPCDELLHLCKARCCQMPFPLSTADLDEGVVRWDYGQPYVIRQRASDGFCVHNDPASRGCTVHAQRPATCRRYDCRDDERVWIDFAKRIPAPLDHLGDGKREPFDLLERARSRAAAEVVELNAIAQVYPDDEPEVGPAPAPRPPRRSRGDG